MREQQKIDELEKQIRQLRGQKMKLEGDRFEKSREVRKTESALDRFRAEDKQDEQDEAARNGWFGFLYRQSAEEAEERNRNRSRRMTGRIVLEKRLMQHKTAVVQIESQLSVIDATLEIKRSEQRTACQRQEQARLAAEQVRQAEQFRKDADAGRKREEQLKKAQEAERLRREEMVRTWHEAEQRRKEDMARKAENAAEQRRREEPSQGAESRRRERGSTKSGGEHRQTRTLNAKRGAAEAICRHKGWWQQTQGRATCQHCQQVQPLFLFCCPGCQVMACAKCRRILGGGSSYCAE